MGGGDTWSLNSCVQIAWVSSRMGYCRRQSTRDWCEQLNSALVRLTTQTDASNCDVIKDGIGNTHDTTSKATAVVVFCGDASQPGSGSYTLHIVAGI